MKWQVTPLTTFIMVLLALSPCLFRTWKDPRPRLIVRSVAYAYTCGFLFGWHVHEKASLHFSIPLAIVAVESLEDAKHYFLLSIGNASPLLSLCWLLNLYRYHNSKEFQHCQGYRAGWGTRTLLLPESRCKNCAQVQYTDLCFCVYILMIYNKL